MLPLVCLQLLTFVDCVQTKHNPGQQVAAVGTVAEDPAEEEYGVGWISGARGGGTEELEHRCEWLGLDVSYGVGVDPHHIMQQWAAAVPPMNGRWVLVNGRYKAAISKYSDGKATLTFEAFNGEADPDNGRYNLLEAEVDWVFSSAPQ